MMLSLITNPYWLGHIIALLAGAITPLFLAPFNLWLLAPLSIGLFYLGLKKLSATQAILRGWCYGFGAYLSGVSWIYVSIHTYGNASTLLASFLTILFCACIAFFFVIPAFIWVKWIRNNQTHLIDCFSFAGLWMLQEWFRGWFLTGFPWLYSGYSQLNGPLAGFAPIGGVWFISFLIALFAVLFTQLFTLYKQKQLIKLYTTFTLLISIPILGLLLNQINWTITAKQPIPVTLIQGNVAQLIKWDPKYYTKQLIMYRDLTFRSQVDNSLVVWSENAIPYLKNSVEDYLSILADFEKNHYSALITGVPIEQTNKQGDKRYYNGVIAIGEGKGTYLKQKLVPFGEYVPLEETLRGIITFFDLPMSDFSKGPAHQPLLEAKGYLIAPFICYEVVYPDFVATAAAKSNLLLTISNDTWFGNSIGPKQHLQMAQMRALEAGRWMIRSTNNGITALINPKGHIVKTIPAFKTEILQGTVYPVTGETPYLLWRSWPLIIISIICLGIGLYTRKRQLKPNK